MATTHAAEAPGLTAFVPELGAEVERNGERGIVVGFGSLAVAFPRVGELTEYPSVPMVAVEMGRWRTRRTFSLRDFDAAGRIR